jgi:hypothetical protein
MRNIEHELERKWSHRIFFGSIFLAFMMIFRIFVEPVQAKGETGRLKNILIEEGIGTVHEEEYENKLFFPNDNLLPDGTNLSKLSYAVAMAETKNCVDKTNFTIHNNCHGIILSEGIGRYKTKQASHEHFKDIWKRMYGRYPDKYLATRYSGNDRADDWLRIVNYYYN